VPNPVGAIVFPEALPVSARRDEIAGAIRDHQVVIVSGETGSGKTTQLPKICLSLGRGLGVGGRGLIGHTQPRRLAATATARRIATELESPLGDIVGYKIRFNDRLAPGASVKLMTDGILLAETQGDPLLSAYDTIIIDEAHERSLNIDFLLGYLRQILPKRPDLKLIVTSATIDAARFAEHFGFDGKPAPVIEVSGRLYPVEVRYRPIGGSEASTKKTEPATIDERGVVEAIVDAVDELARIGAGDVLVFLPGEREIRDTAAVLRGHHPPHTEILPLFARLSAEEQERVFKPSNARRIVLATNVAETSLTVPGIRYVVDTGLARVKRYSYRNKVEQLRTEPISRAAANQRAGRCGRVAAGVCIRLYDEHDFDARPAFTEPEILRSSLAAVILRMKTLGLGEVEAFPFLEPPLPRAISDGYQLLAELGAIDDLQRLTTIGHELGRLPLDPRIARMIVAAREQDCMAEMLVLASALSVQDPRDRPIEQRDAADEAHRTFVDERSDFLSDLKLWQWYAAAIGDEHDGEAKKSQRQLRDLCRSRFISPLRMREWRDVHHQLATTVAEHRWRVGTTPATYEQIHKALLAGLLGNIGTRSEEDASNPAPYLGARGIRFTVWPGSALARKSAKARWVMAAELVETQRLYARRVARIEPEWVEAVGAHLLKTSHGDPHWEKKPAQVVVLERGTVYGLPVYGQRRVDYAPLNPSHAREIFIREALVETMLHRDTRASSGNPPPFESREPATMRMLAYDRKQIAAVEEIEHKTRRPDVLVDAELLVAFCDTRIPAGIASGKAFETWYRDASQQDARLLYLDRDELMRHEAAGAGSDAFPKTLAMGGITFSLDYRFEPGTPRDGVTMTVPLYALNVVDAARCEWLVPGMLKDKVAALLKSLPQKLRRHCVPLPTYADGFIERVEPHGPLVEALIADLRDRLRLVATTSDFKDEAVPPHLAMNFRIVDETGRQRAMGRHLAALRAELGPQARDQFKEAFAKAGGTVVTSSPGNEKSPSSRDPVVRKQATPAASTTDDSPLTAWTFGPLPELLEVRRGGQTLIGYPALVDHRTHATLDVFDDPLEAARVHRGGLARLFRLQLAEQLRFLEKNLPDMTRLAMQFMALGTADELREQIVAAAVDRACLVEPLPTDAAAFEARKEDARTRIVLLANEIARTVGGILDQHQIVQKKTAALKPHAAALADVEAQLGALVHRRFVATTPPDRLAHLPRYLKAVAMRIDKLAADSNRDAQRLAEFSPLQKRWQRVVAAQKGAVDAGLDDYRWLLEELRVALFAQELRTPMPVSVKRLDKVWESLQR
jgi:ATP-dependent helicase HrpA